MTKEEYVKKYLSGGSREWAEAEYARVMAGDHYDECPFKATGFSLQTFDELPPVIIGPDGKCVCTKDDRCLNVDRRDGNRCTLAELRLLNDQARARRAWQSGGDY